MPLTRPSFPRAPYLYSNREHLIMTYHTDRRTRIMAPTPRPKISQISPIFIGDNVNLAVSREKDGKLRLV